MMELNVYIEVVWGPRSENNELIVKSNQQFPIEKKYNYSSNPFCRLIIYIVQTKKVKRWFKILLLF